MTDKFYPSAKPPAAPNGGALAVSGTAATNPPAKPSQHYRPYRPQPASNQRHRRRCRCTLCCCCFWAILLFLMLLLLAGTASAVLYVLYRPHRPDFSILALRTKTLRLTTDTSASSSRLSAYFNLTLSSKNPNSHYFAFFYDPFAITFLSSGVPVGNSSIPAFTSRPKNQTVFKSIIVSAISEDLDTDSVKSLRSDLGRAHGIPLRVHIDTWVKVKAGKLKSKKVGIRVVCDGMKGVVAPEGKSPTVATLTDARCKVNFRIKIWRFTF